MGHHPKRVHLGKAPSVQNSKKVFKVQHGQFCFPFNATPEMCNVHQMQKLVEACTVCTTHCVVLNFFLTDIRYVCTVPGCSLHWSAQD